jgi:hypothetical protein
MAIATVSCVSGTQAYAQGTRRPQPNSIVNESNADDLLNTLLIDAQDEQKAGDGKTEGAAKDVSSVLPVSNLYIMAADMAENLYTKNPTDANRADMLASLEALVTRGCFGGLFKDDYRYDGPPVQGCNHYISKILGEDPENPIAVCAQNGIDSPRCQQTAAKQLVREFDERNVPDAQRGIGLLTTRPTDAQNDVRKANDEWGKTLFAYNAKRTPENKVAALKAMRRVLNIMCKPNKIVYEPARPMEAGPTVSAAEELGYRPRGQQRAEATPTQEPSLSGGSWSFFPGKQDGAAEPTIPPPPTPTPLPAVLQRVRLVARFCAMIVAQGKEAGFKDWSMICQVQGFQTPQCIQALRNFREYGDPAVAPPPSPAGGGAATIDQGNGGGFTTF